MKIAGRRRWGNNKWKKGGKEQERVMAKGDSMTTAESDLGKKK